MLTRRSREPHRVCASPERRSDSERVEGLDELGSEVCDTPVMNVEGMAK